MRPHDTNVSGKRSQRDDCAFVRSMLFILFSLNSSTAPPYYRVTSLAERAAGSFGSDETVRVNVSVARIVRIVMIANAWCLLLPYEEPVLGRSLPRSAAAVFGTRRSYIVASETGSRPSPFCRALSFSTNSSISLPIALLPSEGPLSA